MTSVFEQLFAVNSFFARLSMWLTSSDLCLVDLLPMLLSYNNLMSYQLSNVSGILRAL
jgi:hypothetical protein